MRFRSVALRAKDLTPLDGRPGIWTVSDPSGRYLFATLNGDSLFQVRQAPGEVAGS